MTLADELLGTAGPSLPYWDAQVRCCECGWREDLVYRNGKLYCRMHRWLSR